MSDLWPCVKRRGQKRAQHWQHNTDVQDLKDKPWRNEELKSLDEGMTRLKEGDLEKVARNYKASTGVGCNGFRTEVPLDLSKRTKRRRCGIP